MQKGIAGLFLVLLILVISGTVVGTAFLFNKYKQNSLNQKITDYDSCIKLQPNVPRITIYPGVCSAPDGRSFTQPISDEEKRKLVPPTISQNASAAAGLLTENWKVYTDKENRFSFKYPPELILMDNSIISLLPSKISDELLKKIESESPIAVPLIDIYIDGNPPPKFTSSTNVDLYIIKPQRLKLGEQEGYYYQKSCTPVCSIDFDIPYNKDNQTLRLSLFTEKPENIKSLNATYNTNFENISEETFKKIISTVKLLH